MSSRKIIMLLCRGSKMLTFNCLTSQIDQAPIRNLELGLCITIKNQLIRFRPIFPFHTAWKLQKIKGIMNASPVWLIYTAWKVSKYGVISGPYFPVFGLNTEIYSVFSPKTGKYGPEVTPYLESFHAVYIIFKLFIFSICFNDINSWKQSIYYINFYRK